MQVEMTGGSALTYLIITVQVGWMLDANWALVFVVGVLGLLGKV
jgi:hypothetical protein